jgi:archaellum component FlaF (FlaF/FlaG flagellin family)
MNKKGDVNIVAVVLTILFVVAIATLIFVFIKQTATEGSEKSGDRSTAQNICNDEVEILIKAVIDNGDYLNVNVENLGKFPINDFVVRMEQGEFSDVRKVKQFLGGYESITLTVDKPNFNPRVLKIIPRITLRSPEIDSVDEGWWICSQQFDQYDVY